jgi:hypothetical protein
MNENKFLFLFSLPSLWLSILLAGLLACLIQKYTFILEVFCVNYDGQLNILWMITVILDAWIPSCMKTGIRINWIYKLCGIFTSLTILRIKSTTAVFEIKFSEPLMEHLLDLNLMVNFLWNISRSSLKIRQF